MLAHARRQGVLLLLLFFCAAATGRAADGGPTVAAALSLKNAFEDVAKIYQAAYPGRRVLFNFAASGVLQRQIEGGAPLDVFASASPREMDALGRKNLIVPGTRSVIARNALVLVVPERSGLGLEGFADLGMAQVRRIVIGNPSTVPAGKYAEETLRSLGLWDVVREKLVFAEHVRQAVDYTVRGEVDAGIVFATDAAGVAGVAVVETAPEESHAPALYPVAVLKDAGNPAGAQAFINVLRSPEGREALRRRGFRAAP